MSDTVHPSPEAISLDLGALEIVSCLVLIRFNRNFRQDFLPLKS
jgi:hypothetical protein